MSIFPNGFQLFLWDWVLDLEFPFNAYQYTYVSLFILPKYFPTYTAQTSCPEKELFATGGQSIRVSALEIVLTMNIQCWFSLGLTDLIL